MSSAMTTFIPYATLCCSDDHGQLGQAMALGILLQKEGQWYSPSPALSLLQLQQHTNMHTPHPRASLHHWTLLFAFLLLLLKIWMVPEPRTTKRNQRKLYTGCIYNLTNEYDEGDRSHKHTPRRCQHVTCCARQQNITQ